MAVLGHVLLPSLRASTSGRAPDAAAVQQLSQSVATQLAQLEKMVSSSVKPCVHCFSLSTLRSSTELLTVQLLCSAECALVHKIQVASALHATCRHLHYLCCAILVACVPCRLRDSVPPAAAVTRGLLSAPGAHVL